MRDVAGVVTRVAFDPTRDPAPGAESFAGSMVCQTRSLTTFCRPPAPNVRGQVVGKTTRRQTMKAKAEASAPGAGRGRSMRWSWV